MNLTPKQSYLVKFHYSLFRGYQTKVNICLNCKFIFIIHFQVKTIEFLTIMCYEGFLACLKVKGTQEFRSDPNISKEKTSP